MLTRRGLFPRLLDRDELDRAAAAAVRGKRGRADVGWFLLRREATLESIAKRLTDGSWRPLGFDLLFLRDPKPRVIARAPFEDRIVHTAVVRQLEPCFLPSCTSDSFACREGMGTHRALLRLLELARRHRFALHLDVRSYFPSIDLEVLRRLLAERIDDEPFLGVVDRILESGRGLLDGGRAREFARLPQEWPPPGRGLPIGALTSQLFAGHVYLLAFDHFVKRDLHVPGYVRYMDDLFLFGDRRADLRRWRVEVGEWLFVERHLRLKYPGARILACRGHLDALGKRITREGVAPLPRKPWRRLRRELRDPAAWRRGKEHVQRSVEARVAHLMFGC